MIVQVEYWRAVSGYINYEVSSHGRVRNSTYHIMKPSLNKEGYKRVSLYHEGRRKTFNVHRLVAQAFIDNPENKPVVDHINHDTTNNMIDNLRWATVSENGMNQKKQKGTSSKYKGVRWHTRDLCFEAKLKHKGKGYYLGYYRTEEEAARAYDAKARELFGDYAKLNFPVN